MPEKHIERLTPQEIAVVNAAQSMTSSSLTVSFTRIVVPGTPCVIEHSLIKLTDATLKLVVHVHNTAATQQDAIGRALQVFCHKHLQNAGVRVEAAVSLMKRSSWDFLIFDLPQTTAGLIRDLVLEVLLTTLRRG